MVGLSSSPRFRSSNKHAHVHIHLPYVLMAQLAGFQVDQNKTLEQVIIEHQVDIEVVGFAADAELPPDEGQTLAHLQQELLEIADDGGFQCALVIAGGFR